MSDCRFLYENLVTGPGGLSVSSALPGAVGTPAPEALGSAMCYAGGSHTGRQDQVFVVEIDGEGGDGAVGNATFRWQRASAEGWEASGVPTATAFIPLADGVMVKWAGGAGQELYKGDRWSLLAVGRHGEQPLCDRDRDTRWQADGCVAEWVQVELAEAARAQAVVLGDHNLSDGAIATLKATDTPEPAAPLWSFDSAGGALLDGAGIAGSNTRATGRTYIDGGVLRYAEPGESCFEDGKLSIQPTATNLWAYSENFGGGWYLQYLTQQAAATIGPDGLLSGAKLAESNSATDPKYIRKAPSVSDETVYVASIFLKKAERDWAHIAFQTKAGAYPVAYFDLANGAAGSTSGAIVGHGIQEIGDGWYRCWAAVDTSSGGYTFMVYYGLALADLNHASAGVVGQGLYAWGAQCELGAVPTAYIPTTTAAASRAADAVRWDLPQEVKNLLSSEQPTPTADLTQAVGTLAASMVDGAALVMPGIGSAADLSPYAGSHLIKLIDSAGKVAWAWLGAAGTGEALGSELLGNPSFDAGVAGWNPGNASLASVAGGQSGNCLEITMTGGSWQEAYSNSIPVTANALYELSAYIKSGTSGDGSYRLSSANGTLTATNAIESGTSTGSWVRDTLLCTSGYATMAMRLHKNNAAAGTMLFDQASVRQVTAPPATGCLVAKTPGGPNGWAHIDSGFNPNNIASWAVYAAADWNAEGTLVVRGWEPGVAAGQVVAGYHGIVSVRDSHYGPLEFAPAGIYTDCGETFVGAALSYTAGEPYDLAVRWSSATNLFQVGYKPSGASSWTWGGAGAFDGAFDLGDYLHLCYGAAHACRLGGVELHGAWLGDPLERSLSPWENPEHAQALAITRPHVVGFLDQTYRYWRLELEDPDNPEGGLGASLFYLGGCFAPERTFAANYTRGTVAGRRLTTSEAGKVAGNATALAGFYELSFPRLPAADAAAFEAMMAAIHDHASGGLRPILFTPFSDDPASTLYCLPDASLTRRRLAGGRWELGLRLEEVVRTDV